ncbi:MAG: hypothetical protein WBD41_17810, partial [Rhodococcus sp. (in: high G+C Gram-positive bacteria)]
MMIRRVRREAAVMLATRVASPGVSGVADAGSVVTLNQTCAQHDSVLSGAQRHDGRRHEGSTVEPRSG